MVVLSGYQSRYQWRYQCNSGDSCHRCDSVDSVDSCDSGGSGGSGDSGGSGMTRFIDSLEMLFTKRRRKQDITIEKIYCNVIEESCCPILFDQYDSPCCWNNVEVVGNFYMLLKSEAARLTAMKEQRTDMALIRYLGFVSRG